MKKNNNIYLTGMMGAGKTTIGKLLKQELKINLIDADEYIIMTQKMSISDIFAKFGEKKFRDIETKMLKKISKLKNTIVSTGGGIILRNENIKIMRTSGIIINIYRSCKNIIKTIDTNSRPLLKNGRSKIYSIYKTRKEIYRKTADIIISNNTNDIGNAVKRILKKLDIYN
ncbi:MAG: shikimate kinase [Mycoplasmataceae bacterium]|jgi:shikimate kinase|nr:shikimate kinase [Mycoplasmataceae bacterium]